MQNGKLVLLKEISTIQKDFNDLLIAFFFVVRRNGKSDRLYFFNRMSQRPDLLLLFGKLLLKDTYLLISVSQ